jgi:DNA-binding Lrp family transcriptional regulator
MADHRRELLQLVEGSPQPDVSIDEIGRAIGLTPEATERLVADLERDGHITRDGDRVIAVESDEEKAERDEA